jgi:hypothetical protein
VRSTRYGIAVGASLLLALTSSAAGDVATTEETPATKERISADGRPEILMIDQSRRYYVWRDGQGWHLRSSSQKTNTFEGRIVIKNGIISRCRPIGIDSKGVNADGWRLNRERNSLNFVMNTEKSLDGFDFDIAKEATAIEFDLLIAGERTPKRIFVGKAGKRPSSSHFELAIETPQKP